MSPHKRGPNKKNNKKLAPQLIYNLKIKVKIPDFGNNGLHSWMIPKLHPAVYNDRTGLTLYQLTMIILRKRGKISKKKIINLTFSLFIGSLRK